MPYIRRYALVFLSFFLCTTSTTSWAQLKAVSINREAQEIAKNRLHALAISVTPAALVQYAAQGDLATVDLLLNAGISAKNPEPLRRVTALHNAAAQGHIKLVQHLTEYGADVNAQDVNGVTPLHNAVYAGHLEVTRQLLKWGANSNIVPHASPHVLNLAVQRGNLPMFELLLKSVSSVASADNFGHTPLAIAKKLNRTAMIAQLEAALKQ